MAHDIFISYSSKDKSVADAVCARLESRGVRCWIAPRDVQHGVKYGAAIIEAIRGSRVMVLVLSNNANLSQHIPNEIERAVSLGVAILPFRIEDVVPAEALDLFIGSVHWLDALTPPLDRHLDRLAESVLKLLDRPVASAPPTPVPPPPPLKVYKLAAAAAAIAVVLFAAWMLSSRNRSEISMSPAADGDESPPRSGGAMAGGQEIAGCWRWGNGASIVIRPNGTMTAAPFAGQWRYHGNGGYTFTWPEPVDTLTMSANRQRLTGSNQYGVKVTATRVSGGPDLPGSWKWGEVIPVVVEARGAVSMGHLSGSWTLADPGQRLYRVTWPKIQDEVTLSDNGSRIQGTNQYGVSVSGSRTTCP